jgi:hypothetical protein
MTIEAAQMDATGEWCEPQVDGESSDEEGDPPDPDPRSSGPAPCSVWFGPTGSASFEREMLAYLGAHNGVAVLQWPRDLERATRCRVLGIPTLWFISDATETAHPPAELQEWLSSSATDREVHHSLRRLSEHGASRRDAAILALDSDSLRLGEGEIHLDSSERGIAAVLVANFDRAVDDESLSCASSHNLAKARRSLFRELLQLDRDVNQLGLEVVPVKEHAHLMRRCGR